MRVDTERTGDQVVLAVVGELDVADTDVPVAAAARALADAVPRRLVVDLAAVTFMGSGGIGSLVRIRTLCHDAGVALTLRGVRRPVRKLLVVTGLDKVFDVAADTPP